MLKQNADICGTECHCLWHLRPDFPGISELTVSAELLRNWNLPAVASWVLSSQTGMGNVLAGSMGNKNLVY